MSSQAQIAQNMETKSFATRLFGLPVVMAGVEHASRLYSSAKERNFVTRMACTAGEKTIQIASTVTKPIIKGVNAFPLSKPIVKNVESAGTWKQLFGAICSFQCMKVDSVRSELSRFASSVFVALLAYVKNKLKKTATAHVGSKLN